ncbi:MAG: hypothetical protein HY302_01445 [Opitutae bacterium]|nr:hypothetical protein [Opitutae bacterium]
MIFSAITLALLSLLVATDPEPRSSTEAEPPAEPPSRPGKPGDKCSSPGQNRWAA